MSRRSPPLECIEAFVAVARHHGIRAAAETLKLSPSGVSRRIAGLETFLGRMLFDRTEQGVRLNAAGRRYLDLVSPAIQAIHRATTAVDEDGNRLVMATSHSLATRWLMPRLTQLRKSDDIVLEVMPTRDPDVLRSGEAHFALWGSLEAPDLMSETMVSARGCPVSLPMLADGRLPPTDVRELIHYPLLSVKQPSGMWQRWLAAANVERSADTIIEFATMAMMVEAALTGMGIALAVPMLCEPQLKSGALIPCGPTLPIGESYKLFRNRGRVNPSTTETRFLHWLRRETAQSVAVFDALSLH
ncbi:LysR family transcriptional regulator [Sphingobium aromaticiconvertens]|uniref:LysR family transcriptional regulator n=1 Tax=Sphingobium aromaticiconvertens TaxID=365341 RepID=UPI003019BD84